MRPRVVSTLEGLRALAPAWNEVLALSETATPFLTHEWILSWWEAFGGHQDLFVLVLEDALGPAAIAPFAVARRRAGPLSYRAIEMIGTGALRFLGMGLSDRSDLLLARRAEECAGMVLQHLAAERKRWDVVDLRFLPEGSTTARVFAARAQEAGIGLARAPLADSPFLRLTGTYEDYLARRGRNFRSGLERRLRKLEHMGTVRFELAAADEGALAAFRSAVGVSLESWKERSGSALFLHSSVRSFFEALIPRLEARRGIYISLLEVGGRIAAHELGFRTGSKLWSYDSAFKREFASGSPGTLLTAKVLEAAWREGLEEYDFLRGGEGYKVAWTAESRREVQLVLDSGTLKGRAARDVAFRAKWALKRRPRLAAAQARFVGILNRLLEGGKKPRE